ncbi:MAG: HPr family phosphocarrier protein [Xanthomonadales bacterium]|nr:HPr family phosphocarrier protein [Xanthomonadales bacterium]
MQKAELTIINKLGLHARAAAKLVHTAAQFRCEVLVARQGREVNAKSIMGVMMLAASRGSVITVTTDGDDEEEALAAVRTLVEGRFGEKK